MQMPDDLLRRAVSRRAVSRRALLQGGLGLLAVPALAACAPRAGHHPAVERTESFYPLTNGQARETIALTRVDVAPVVAGMRRLGADLYGEGATVTENWTISPMSIDVAFGMLRAGARGGTAKQIDHVFGFAASTLAQGSPHAALNALTAHLTTDKPVSTRTSKPSSSAAAPGHTPPPVIAIANGLFVDRSFEAQVQKPFLRLLATQYGASPDAVSFTDASAVDAINAWVTRQTRGRITRLFDQLDPGTLLVLANATYLKAAWLMPFSADQTVTGPFTTGSGHQVGAHLMRQTRIQTGYAAGDGWQRVTLPYDDGDLVMRIVVPTRPARDVATLARALSAAVQPAGTDQSRPVDLTLPRWSTATTLPLIADLTKLGMGDAFGDNADLSGIAPRLFVSDAVHRANISVDEIGTEAAAVTGIGVEALGLMSGPVEVRVDRPFAWAVVHVPTGTPIFTGHVVDPTR